jgi:hypothetical protein
VSPCGPPTTESTCRIDGGSFGEFLIEQFSRNRRLDDEVDGDVPHGICSVVASGPCWVEMTTASTRTGRGSVIFDGDLRFCHPGEGRWRVPSRRGIGLGGEPAGGRAGCGAASIPGSRRWRSQTWSALVAGSAGIDTHRDVWGLGVDCRDDSTGFGVAKPYLARV